LGGTRAVVEDGIRERKIDVIKKLGNFGMGARLGVLGSPVRLVPDAGEEGW
jgi:hypothetical protein